MKFSTFSNGKADGRLQIVSRDLQRAAPAEAAETLLGALEQWDEIAGALNEQYERLNAGEGSPVTATDAVMAPLPRAWQWLDASAYKSHAALMDKAFGFEDKAPVDFPLMYQGMSNQFYGPTDDIPLTDETDGMDFEAEFGVITSAVALGANAATAASTIRLIVQINDWSLRRLAPVEMKTGFGWIRAKPACAMAPVAVTPDELAANWRDHRVDLPLNVKWNDKQFGASGSWIVVHS